jgi:hypothetical protein
MVQLDMQDAGGNPIHVRFLGQMFYDQLLELGLMTYDIRMHVFGLRAEDPGDPRVSRLIPNETFANLGALVRYCTEFLDLIITNDYVQGFLAAVDVVRPLGCPPGAMTATNVYDGISNRARYNDLLHAIAIERSDYPLAIQALEVDLFRKAAMSGYPMFLPIGDQGVPSFPPRPEDENIGWERVIPGDGRFWFAYLR